MYGTNAATRGVLLKKPLKVAVEEISLALRMNFESVFESIRSSKKAMAPVLLKPDATTNKATIVKSPSLSTTFNASSILRTEPPVTFK